MTPVSRLYPQAVPYLFSFHGLLVGVMGWCLA